MQSEAMRRSGAEMTYDTDLLDRRRRPGRPRYGVTRSQRTDFR